MNTIPLEDREQDWDGYDESGYDEELPRRPRRQFFNRWSAALCALILGGVGFYVGVRVEKGQLASSTSPAAAIGGLSSAGGATGASGRAGAAGGGAGRRGAGAAGATGATGATGSSPAGGGFAARFGGAGGLAGAFAGGGNTALGTISSIDGNTLDVQETSGNTVKVKLSSATKISKSVAVSKRRIYPGDSVVIAGVKGAKGSLSATSVSDSGARTTSTTGSSSSSGSSSSGGASSVGSLFGSGG